MRRLNARMDVYRNGEPLDLRGPVMMGALGLLVLDAIVMLFLSGAIATLTRRRRAVAALLALALDLAGADRAARSRAEFSGKAGRRLRHEVDAANAPCLRDHR